MEEVQRCIFEKTIVPYLEEYWQKIFQRKKFTPDRLFFDAIKPLVSKTVDVKPQLYFVCTIPQSIIFWDLIFAMYYLFRSNPEATLSDFARSVVLNLNCNAETFSQRLDNFNKDQANYLEELARGNVRNLFIQDPKSAYIDMRLILTLQESDLFNKHLIEKYTEEFSKTFDLLIKDE